MDVLNDQGIITWIITYSLMLWKYCDKILYLSKEEKSLMTANHLWFSLIMFYSLTVLFCISSLKAEHYVGKNKPDVLVVVTAPFVF